MLERRVRRGDTLEAALSYQLAACTEDEGLAAMVLADPDGEPLVSWGDAALIAADEVRRLRYGGLELQLCAVGGEDDARRRALGRSEAAVARILQRWIAV